MTSNDDRNLKKLADGMAAMSPEPPPYPEEVTMTTSHNPTPGFRPLTMFAGAALIVLLALGIPMILLNSGEDPVAVPETTTTTISGETTTTDNGAQTTTTEPEETTTSTTDGPVGVETEVVVFLLQDPENSFTGNPALVSFATPVLLPPGTNPTLFALQMLTPVDAPIVPPDGFYTAVPEGVEIYSVRVADGAPNALIVETNEKFIEGSGIGLLADVTMLNQLIFTATQNPDIDEVQFIVNNQPVTQFGMEGIDLSGSVNRQTFQDELALINVTSPVLPNGDGNVVVEGISNTFEAAVSLLVTDAQGNVVHEEHTTATAGSGTWGEYLFVLNPALFDDDSIVQVLEYSAQDGSPINVVSVPYNAGLPWDFTGGVTN